MMRPYRDLSLDSLLKLLDIQRANLTSLEEQSAKFGPMHVPTNVKNEIKDVRNEVQELNYEINRKRLENFPLWRMRMYSSVSKITDLYIQIFGEDEESDLTSKLKKIYMYFTENNIATIKNIEDINESMRYFIYEGSFYLSDKYGDKEEDPTPYREIDNEDMIYISSGSSHGKLILSCSKKNFSGSLSIINAFIHGQYEMDLSAIVVVLKIDKNRIYGSPIAVFFGRD